MKKLLNYCFVEVTGEMIRVFSTVRNSDVLFAANYLFVEPRAILFYCAQTEHNFHSFAHLKKK